MPEVKQGTQRISELDGLRGLAILLVLLDHYLGSSRITGFSHYWQLFFKALEGGRFGVDLFFVLSGFLIGGILLGSRDSPHYFRTFYLRRAHRILPVYYSLVLLYLIACAIFHFFLPEIPTTSADFLHAFRYLAFIQNFFWSKTHLEWLLLGVTWSLAIEEQFYLCAPLVIRYVPIRRLLPLLIAVILFAPLLRLLVLLGPEEHRFYASLSTPCRADALALGMLGALAWRSGQFHQFLRENPKIPARVLLFFSLAPGILLPWLYKAPGAFIGTVGYSALALFFLALLLFVLVRRESWIAGIMRVKPLRELGVVSYCVYLVHAPVLHGIHHFLLRDSPRINDLPGVLATLLSVFLTLGISALSWHFMEKPLLKRGHRFVY